MTAILWLLALLILSGFFSGAELALFSLTPEKIHSLEADPDMSPKRKKQIKELKKLKEHSQKTLVTILICNNIVNIAASSLSTMVALNTADALGYGAYQGYILAAVTGIMTLMILIFGEITPKALAHQHALSFSLFAAPVLRVAELILWPLIMPLTYLTKKLTKGGMGGSGMTQAEIRAALELSEVEGEIDAGEKEMVERVLELDTHTVDRIMTPRTRIISLQETDTVQAALDAMAQHHFSRMPVLQENEQAVGIITTHHVIQHIQAGKSLEVPVTELDLTEPIMVPRSMMVDDLRKNFQEQKTSLMALVYGPYGGLVGIITLEDIIEEVFGEIHDETDILRYFIKKVSETSFHSSGGAELEQIEAFIKRKLESLSVRHYPWTLEEENQSLSAFLAHNFGRFPMKDDTLDLRAGDHIFTFTVRRTEGNNVSLVQIDLLHAEEQAE